MQLNSFSDIAFLLIIFFILTTTFVQNNGSRMNIPNSSPSNSESKADQKTPTVTLQMQQILFNDKAITLKALRDELNAAKYPTKPPAERVVILDSSPDVPYQLYYSVLTAIDKSGAVMALMVDDKGKGGDK